MCGLTGFCDSKRHTTRDILIKMTTALSHRGPDDAGYSFWLDDFATAGLGHRRLSILDLSKLGHQPMRSGHLEIVYNGEIYNFRQIRQELEESGYVFSSESDTEVILQAFHRWGINSVHKFNGMFAIAILDRIKRKIFLIRDRAGVKPLFYYKNSELFMFASELKSFHQHPHFTKEIDFDGLALFLKHGYIPQPHCIYKNTRKLEAGHYLEFDIASFTIKTHRYWDINLAYSRPKLAITFDEAVEEAHRLLRSACEFRMVSDVPVGIFLSGGYDSSTVSAILQSERTQKLQTITIGFHEKEFNEAHYAKAIAEKLGTEHTEYYCSIKDTLTILPELPEIFDEPLSDSSSVATTLVSRLARQKVKVCLSADGGDEIFGGYNKYLTVYKKLKFHSKLPQWLIPILKTIGASRLFERSARSLRCQYIAERFHKTVDLLTDDPVQILTGADIHFNRNELKALLLPVHSLSSTAFDQHLNASWLSSIQAVDFATYMVDDVLTKVDRATMSTGLEGREPLLDYRLIEFIAQLPDDYKISGNITKKILKNIAHKYLPEHLLNRPKMGFGVPLRHWFKNELAQYFDHYLNLKRLKNSQIFNPKTVQNLKDRYISGDDTCFDRLWLILVFEMWRERWMKT